MNDHDDTPIAGVADMPSETPVIDLCFPLTGGPVPDDYAAPLAEALLDALPWLADLPDAGVLPLAGSARGDGIRFIGRRTRLIVRVPKQRAGELAVLRGRRFELPDAVTLGAPVERALAPCRVVHSACIDMDTTHEGEFVARCRAALDARDMRGSLVCGRRRRVLTREGVIEGHSLMIYGLRAHQTLALQVSGLGGHRLLGCGNFVPHKNVAAVGGDIEE